MNEFRAWWGGILLLGASGAALYFLARAPEQTPPVADSSHPTQARTPAPAPLPAESTPAQESGAANPPVPLSEQIDTLSASGKPEHAYAAYELAKECHKFTNKPLSAPPNGPMENRRLERFRLPELCRGLTQRIRMSSLEHLAIAAKAGVPGAASDFLEEGPFGDPTALLHRPKDSLVIEWKKLALNQLVAQADLGSVSAVQSMMNAYRRTDGLLVEKNPTMALAYSIAYQKITDGMNLAYRIQNALDDEELLAMEAGMSTDEVALAKRKADDIVNARKKKR